MGQQFQGTFSVCITLSGLPNGIQSELRWGLKKKLHPGDVDIKKQRSFAVCAHGSAHPPHPHTHTQWDAGKQAENISLA